MWRREIRWKPPDVSVEHIESVFVVEEEQDEQDTSVKWSGNQGLPTTRRYIPEDRTLHNRRSENLKS
jgi:hypothetical protein